MKEEKAVEKIMKFVHDNFNSVPIIDVEPDLLVVPLKDKSCVIERRQTRYSITFKDFSGEKDASQ